MARAETETLLPLDRYADIMGIYAPHFNQLNGNKAPLTGGCKNGIWDQDNREDLAWVMSQAEEMIAEYLGFYPIPKFITDEEIAFALPGVRSDWRNAEVTTEWARIECYGTETLTLKMADAPVIYSNADNDPFGREELATISTTGLYVEELGACDNACEVAVFFRVVDGAEDAADPRWEIKPVKVDIDGSTMSITAEASMFVNPSLWELTKQETAGSANTNAYQINYDTANFVTAVDVYCRTCNKQTPVTLRWDGVCDCPGVCQHSTQTACAYQTDRKRGFFVPRPATWNGTTNIEATPLHAIPPESIRVNYRAGMPVNSRNCRMNSNLERAIVKLTNALLPEPPCGFCDIAQKKWQDDRQDIDPLTPEAASMPWDLYKRGALDAWRIVKLFGMGRGGKMGRGYR
jgi:hypothetical protein